MNPSIVIEKDFANKQMTITHSYQAPLETIWNAHTQSELLEKWWAPQPYQAIVVSNDFVEGGKLLYYMLAPTGEKHYCIAEFLAIEDGKFYEVMDAFCDENAVVNEAFPRTKWHNSFSHQNGITTVTNTLTFQTAEAMSQNLALGFEEGYRMGLNQLFSFLKLDKLTTLVFSTNIAANPEKVWHALWDLENYKAWTNVFCEGSYYKTEHFAEGSKIHLLTPNGDGMYSILHRLEPNKYLAFKHLGDLKNFEEMPITAETEAWSGALETYSLLATAEGTQLIACVDTVAEYVDYMKGVFPKGLKTLKEIAEN